MLPVNFGSLIAVRRSLFAVRCSLELSVASCCALCVGGYLGVC